MTLLELLTEEVGSGRRRLLATASLAAVANVLILVSINQLVRSPEARDARAFVTFALLVVLYFLCARRANHQTTAAIESGLHRIKVRVGDRIARAELASLERVRAAEICDRITENTTLISDRAGLIATLLQSAGITAFGAIYIASLSLPALVLVAILCGAGTMIFVIIRRRFVAYSQQSAGIRITFLERLTDLLSGFKEVQFSRRRSRELREDIVAASDALRDVSAKSNNILSDGVILGEGILFALLIAVVYTLRTYVTLDAATLTYLVAGVMFLWGPLMGVTGGIMPYLRSNLALAQIEQLEQKLEVAAREAPTEAGADPWQGRLGAIEVRDIEYTHAVDDGGERFSIGPLNLTLAAGEVVFIVGGNGSGKSTFLKVLTGLYAPSAGSLHVGGVEVGAENVAAFRDMVSAIFSDFHLFAKLYGLTGVDDAAVHRLLVRMRLEGKTSLANRTFTKLTLSTGQKKRLAMIVALLEERPLYVFDEWAADQDPEFRKYFYEELLPLLRQERKTVIVVSHDDRYFHCADRVVTMEYGRIRSIQGPAPSVGLG